MNRRKFLKALGLASLVYPASRVVPPSRVVPRVTFPWPGAGSEAKIGPGPVADLKGRSFNRIIYDDLVSESAQISDQMAGIIERDEIPSIFKHPGGQDTLNRMAEEMGRLAAEHIDRAIMEEIQPPRFEFFRRDK